VLAEVLLLTEFTSGAGGGNVSEAVALTSGDTDSDCEVSFTWLDGVGLPASFPKDDDSSEPLEF
jgi:hypothetical protein